MGQSIAGCGGGVEDSLPQGKDSHYSADPVAFARSFDDQKLAQTSPGEFFAFGKNCKFVQLFLKFDSRLTCVLHKLP